MDRKQFTFYDSFYESISELKSVRARAQCYENICRYALRGELPDMEALLPEARTIFRLVRPILDTASKRAAAGMAKKQNRNKRETKSKQKQNKKEIKIENKIEIENEIERDCEYTHAGAGAREKFAVFWDMYPKKVGKEQAWVEFQRVEVSLQVLLDALQGHKRSAQWLEEEGRYIPRAAQWLKQQRWLEKLSAPPGKAAANATGELGEAELAAIQRMLAEG